MPQMRVGSSSPWGAEYTWTGATGDMVDATYLGFIDNETERFLEELRSLASIIVEGRIEESGERLQREEQVIRGYLGQLNSLSPQNRRREREGRGDPDLMAVASQYTEDLNL